MALSETFALVVGPTKAGTTWVQAYLETCAQVALPLDRKETFFFDKVFENGFDWYCSLFPADPDGRIRVEVAPSLFHKPYACERALDLVPKARIICIVRNPFDRAVSHYFHYRKMGVERQSLASMANEYPDVIESGLFHTNTRRWEEAFGAENVHLLSFRQMCDDPAGFCRELCALLDVPYVPPDPGLRDKTVNAAKVPRNLIAARVFHATTRTMRAVGFRRLVTMLKVVPFKKLVYSGGADFKQERAEIRAQTGDLTDLLGPDWEAFQRRPDFPAWPPQSKVG
ncbi:sulfotransferase domain-containing protein [Aliiroseovarius sp.]|uniref:sulfotransferase domain-containing protein n=1 Tax=Aliiroseovarius sp. TaxID=1872442 RepID=UPI003BAB5A39